MSVSNFTRGIRENRVQVAHQLIQVMLVGFAIGMTRTVVPALAESEFGLERGSFMLLASFVVAFGAVKAVMNFVAGRCSERIGRKRVEDPETGKGRWVRYAKTTGEELDS